MKPQNKWTFFLPNLFFSLIFLSFSLSSAWAGYIFKFDPSLITEERYDDNLFLTRSDTRSDWITTISPGFTAYLTHPRINAEVEYHPGFVYFLHNPQFDYTSHDLNFNGTIELTPRLTFSLNEIYIRSSEPQFEEFGETDFERSQRNHVRAIFNRNVITPFFEYRFGIENLISLYYRNTNHRSSDPTQDDYRENYVENVIEYWFNIKNAINIRSHFIKGNFDIETDLLYSVDVTARYIHRFTPHFQLYGEYGYGEADFDERRFFQSLDDKREFQVDSEDVEDYDLHKFNFGFEWFLPRNLRIEGSIGYFWSNGKGHSRDDQGINSLFAIEKATENLVVNLQWESGYSANYFALRDSGFARFWEITTNATYNYHEKLEVRLRGSYGYAEYSDVRGEIDITRDKREDYRYVAQTTVIYHILRNYHFLSDLSFEMIFSHIELDSNFDTDYFINNQSMLRIIATF